MNCFLNTPWYALISSSCSLLTFAGIWLPIALIEYGIPEFIHEPANGFLLIHAFAL
jgi:hypothetical protein